MKIFPYLFGLTLSASSAFAGAYLPPTALQIPLYRQQTTYSCGAAALYSVLKYWQVYEGTEQGLYAPLQVDSEDGTQWTKIHEVAQTFGLTSVIREQVTISDLREALARGDVPILEIQAWANPPSQNIDWKERWDDGHYTILISMDDQYAYFMDSAVYGPTYVYTPLSELEDRWHNWAIGFDGEEKQFQHVAIMIHGKKPPQTRLSPIRLIRLQ